MHTSAVSPRRRRRGQSKGKVVVLIDTFSYSIFPQKRLSLTIHLFTGVRNCSLARYRSCHPPRIAYTRTQMERSAQAMLQQPRNYLVLRFKTGFSNSRRTVSRSRIFFELKFYSPLSFFSFSYNGKEIFIFDDDKVESENVTYHSFLLTKYITSGDETMVWTVSSQMDDRSKPVQPVFGWSTLRGVDALCNRNPRNPNGTPVV